MATGRTISASFLTKTDRKVLEHCKAISDLISSEIPDESLKKEFLKKYGKISYTRDGGMGLGAGKLQRDAICTRGRQGKAPFSNRNLRWHPMVVAQKPITYAKGIEEIRIEGKDEEQLLIFVVKIKDKKYEYPADRVHELPERFVALPKHWVKHIDRLKHWNDTLWTQNSCVIPAYEACNPKHSLETYAVLALSVAVEYYNLKFDSLLPLIIELLQNQTIDRKLFLPSKEFPLDKVSILTCPVCKLPLSDGLNRFRKEERVETWQPSWRRSKKKEGDDGSNQILHINPLSELEIRHKPDTVRFGHRWCNVAMTDHSLEETINFMEFIVNSHKNK